MEGICIRYLYLAICWSIIQSSAFPTLILSPLKTIDTCQDCMVGEDTQRTSISCKPDGDTGPYNVTLWIGDTLLPAKKLETGEFKAFITLNSTLDHQAKLKCSFENNAVSTSTLVYVTVETVTAPSLRITSSRLLVRDPVNITCIKTNVRPAATNITMLIDGNMVYGLELRHQLDNVTLLYNSWVTLTTTPRDWNKKSVTCCEYNDAFYTVDYSMCSSPEPVDLVSVTLTDDSRNSSVYILPDDKSWFEGFNACNREKNASDEDYGYKLPENKTYIAELVSSHSPMWTYGLEVIFHQNGKTNVFQINRINPSLPAVGVCSLDDRDPVMSIDPNRSYTEAQIACHKWKTSIPIVTPTNITLYAIGIIVRESFWVASINEELYLNDQGIDVRCLLYDSNGDIKTDDCNSKHKTLCVAENAMPVVKYVANVTLPRLRTESSKDSNEAGPNIGAIIGGVIGGIACVGLIILAVFCQCCRHRNTKDKKEGNIELQDKKDTESEVKDDGSSYYNISKPAQYECLGGATGTSEYTSLSRPELGAVQSNKPAQYECLGEGTGASVYTSLSQPELDVAQSNEPARYECLDGRNSASEYTSLSRPELGADKNKNYENL